MHQMQILKFLQTRHERKKQWQCSHNFELNPT